MKLPTVAVAVLASVGINVPAEAAAPSFNEACVPIPELVDHTPKGPADQSLCWPLEPGATVVIDTNGSKAWRIRRAVRALDPLVEGLQFITDRSADCDQYPGTYCIRVKQVWDAESPYAGWFQFDDPRWEDRTRSTIYLNNHTHRDVKFRKSVALHELFHAIGFEHHTEIGLMGEPDWTMEPQDFEIAVLNGWYGGQS